MLLLFGFLLVVNIVIYAYIRKERNFLLIAFVTLVFILWCATVDIVRAREIIPSFTIFIPALLIVYTVVSGLIGQRRG